MQRQTSHKISRAAPNIILIILVVLDFCVVFVALGSISFGVTYCFAIPIEVNYDVSVPQVSITNQSFYPRYCCCCSQNTAVLVSFVQFHHA
jgi:hypothetical protein